MFWICVMRIVEDHWPTETLKDWGADPQVWRLKTCLRMQRIGRNRRSPSSNSTAWEQCSWSGNDGDRNNNDYDHDQAVDDDDTHVYVQGTGTPICNAKSSKKSLVHLFFKKFYWGPFFLNENALYLQKCTKVPGGNSFLHAACWKWKKYFYCCILNSFFQKLS